MKNQPWDVFLMEPNTNKHIGTRYNQSDDQVEELKQQFSELSLKKAPYVPPPEPEPEPEPIRKGMIDA